MKQNARILLSNDDGVHAPGIKLLERIARTLCQDVWIVAPDAEQSGAAHSVTLNRPLRIHQIEEKRFSVDGTPTDCMVLGILKIMKDYRPDLMLSGINNGSNFAEDVTYSGTVAAAMEATLLGIPAIALSQAHVNGKPNWHTAEVHAPQVIKKLLQLTWPKNVLININFPSVPHDEVKGVRVVRQGLRQEGLAEELREWHDPYGRPYYWLLGALREENFNEKDTDISVIRDGWITVTPLHLDLTHYETLKKLEQQF